METLFNICVALMIKMSHVTGISYQAINIWRFVIIHPVITLFFILKYYSLKRRHKGTMRIAVELIDTLIQDLIKLRKASKEKEKDKE